MTNKQTVNPMVAKKLRHTVAPNLEVISTMLKDSVVPVIKADALAAKSDQRAAKFSDLFHYKNFITSNKLGTVEIKVSGAAKDSLMQRVMADYLSKDLTPNCSIDQIFKIGGKISVSVHLTPEAKALIDAKADATDKPKRTRKAATKAEPKAKKASAKPKAAKKAPAKAKKAVAAPAKRARKVVATKTDGAAPAKRVRKVKADGAATAVEVKPEAPQSGPKADWDN